MSNSNESKIGKRYRYITCGTCSPTDPVSNYRLISGTSMAHMSDGVRIEIPEDMKLEKWSYDCYSTTDDKRLIKNLNPKVMIRINMTLTHFEDLQEAWLNGEVEPHEFEDYLSDHHGYDHWLKFGCITHMQRLFCSKFPREVLMLDKLPNIKSQTEIDSYVFPYPFEVNKARMERLRDYFKEYSEFTEEVRAELSSWDNKKLLCEIYKYADHCCTNNPNEVEKHLKNDFEKKMMSYYWNERAEDAIWWKKRAAKAEIEPQGSEDKKR